jgi:uncharacterized membrane protein
MDKKLRDQNEKSTVNFGVRFWVQAAIIAAVYAVFTMVLAPLSYGLMQVRVSEALTVLPFFTSAAVPGLFIGCLISNTLTGNPIDIIFGSLATLIAAFASYKLRRFPILVPLPPVVINALIIGPILCYAYSVDVPLWSSMLWVGTGQVLACYILGYPLLKYFQNKNNIFDLNK